MLRLVLAVSALLLPLSLLAAPLLIANINGYTLDSAGAPQRFDAILMDEGRVVATGARDALHATAPTAVVHDGQGRTLLPGLTDAHGHVMGLGWGLHGADVINR